MLKFKATSTIHIGNADNATDQISHTISFCLLVSLVEFLTIPLEANDYCNYRTIFMYIKRNGCNLMTKLKDSILVRSIWWFRFFFKIYKQMENMLTIIETQYQLETQWWISKNWIYWKILNWLLHLEIILSECKTFFLFTIQHQ